jgi:hypothetical protein
MGRVVEELKRLHDAAQAGDEDCRAVNSVKYEPVTAQDIEATEQRLGVSLPPSYKRFVVEFGTFGIGTDPTCDHLCFRLLGLSELQTVHQILEEDYEATTSADIADNMGVEEEYIAATRQGLVFAMEGHEDYWVFDQRSRDEGTGECKVVGLLLEDRELEYFAKHDDFSEQQFFDDFLMTVVEGRKDDCEGCD